jgi:ABC-2 type transport system permease protein
MRVLGAYFVAGFRRWSAYRAAAAAGAITNTVFGLIKTSILIAAIDSAGGSIAGYDARTASTYAWLTQALLAPINVFMWNELANRVRTGDVAVDLARPVDLQLGYLAADLGRAAFLLVPRGAPPLIAGALTFGLAMPNTAAPYLLGAVSLVVAVTISFACRYAMNLLAFWVVDVRGLLALYLFGSSVFCGLMIPVHWFPRWLATLSAATPFPSMLQAPVDIISGRGGAHTLVVQLAWMTAMLYIGRLLTRAATRQLVVQGG